MAITIVQRNRSKGILTWYARVPDKVKKGSVHFFSLGTESKAKALPGGFPGKAHAHRFRHSFGSNLIRAGVNIKVVQTLMRHENIQMTLDIYGHIMDSDAEDAIVKTFP